MAIFELDPVDDIAVAAVGEPGQRRFFLLAKGRGRTLTLTCEKAQIQALIVRVHQMLEAQGIELPERLAGKAALAPGDPEWQVGEMGLGYHDAPARCSSWWPASPLPARTAPRPGTHQASASG